jgi:hypothetical protein
MRLLEGQMAWDLMGVWDRFCSRVCWMKFDSDKELMEGGKMLYWGRIGEQIIGGMHFRMWRSMKNLPLEKGKRERERDRQMEAKAKMRFKVKLYGSLRWLQMCLSWITCENGMEHLVDSSCRNWKYCWWLLGLIWSELQKFELVLWMNVIICWDKIWIVEVEDAGKIFEAKNSFFYHNRKFVFRCFPDFFM